MNGPTIRIADRVVGAAAPVYVIAEMSANHLGDFDRAVKIVHAAADAGADAIKLQTYTAQTMTLDADQEHFRIGAGTPWANQKLADVYEGAATPWGWTEKLMAVAADRGLHCFSSPFDATAVDFLDDLDVPAFKIASFEAVDLALIARAARTGKPLIMSTGLCNDEEVDDAVAAARNVGATGIALLKCTSAYPAPPEAANLRAIPALHARHELPVGLSDHTLDHTVVTAAVALGACIVEKHLTLARADGGPDASFSLEPDEFTQMVRTVRTTEAALGTGTLAMHDAERATAAFRRSLFIVASVKAGEALTEDNVRALRPGNGLAPKHLPDVLGRVASRDLVRGTPLQWDCIR